jgi:glycosyltransferase involved in cell wall biosynthesis
MRIVNRFRRELLEGLRLRFSSGSQSFFQVRDDLDDPIQLEFWTRRFQLARKSKRYREIFHRKTPLVSVCITTADRPDILAERALNSIREQTYDQLEVVIVGDQCTEATEETVRKFNDKRFRYINLPVRGPYPRPGIDRWRVAGTNPVNLALKLATGDFITHLDEDDTYSADRIEVLVDEIQREEADLVFHPFYWEQDDRSLQKLGNGVFELGQTGTGLILYHQWLGRVPWDLYAYRRQEPGDWNRLRKIKAMGAKTHYVDRILSWHWKYPLREPFVAKPNEVFLD